jgi:hypothetical protein
VSRGARGNKNAEINLGVLTETEWDVAEYADIVGSFVAAEGIFSSPDEAEAAAEPVPLTTPPIPTYTPVLAQSLSPA